MPFVVTLAHASVHVTRQYADQIGKSKLIAMDTGLRQHDEAFCFGPEPGRSQI